MRRPVLAIVFNMLIVVAGLAAFYGVEIRELPDVDRPVITVRADYDGRRRRDDRPRGDRMLEGAVARVSGVKSISSSSAASDAAASPSNSTMASTSNVAASDLRDAVGNVHNQLPDDVDPPRIVKADANADAGHAARGHLRRRSDART